MRRSHVIVVTGAGGVGKTTLSAALGVVAARAGKEVLVITVDPARRLSDALGIPGIGNRPTPVPDVEGLSAAMLDVTASWEAITRRHAHPDVADRLDANPFFRTIADRFPAAQSYAAAEQMAEFVETGYWDLVVVDTPPSAGGLDFFLAPRRMRDLIGGRLLRWLTGARLPARRTLYRITAKPVLRVADAILGGPLLEEIAEFLLDVRTLYDGLAARARSIERLMVRAATIVVSTATPASLREARRFYEELTDVDVTPRGVVFNRALPVSWIDAANAPPPDGRDALALRDNLRRWGEEAQRMHEARRKFAARHQTSIATIPWLESAPTTIEELTAMVRAADGLELAGLTG